MGASPPPNCWLRYMMPLLRVLGCLCGATVIALGCYKISLFHDWTLLTRIDRLVLNLYRIFFGMLILFSELRLSALLRWFSFLTFFSGQAAFYIFVGGWAMGSAWYEIVLAVLMCTIGGVYVVCACGCSDYAHEQRKRHQASWAAKDKQEEEEHWAAKLQQNEEESAPYRELEEGDTRRAKKQQQKAQKAQKKSEPIKPVSPFGDSDETTTNNTADTSTDAYSYGESDYRKSKKASAYGVSDYDDPLDSGNPFAASQARGGAAYT